MAIGDFCTVRVVLDEMGGFSWAFDGIDGAEVDEILYNVGADHFEAQIRAVIAHHGPDTGSFYARVPV